jgi:hypothetical protein
VKRTISHHDQKGIPIIQAQLADDTSYSTFSAYFPCYNINVASNDEDSDYHVVEQRNKRKRTKPSVNKTKPQKTSFSTTYDPPHVIPANERSPKDMLMGYHMQLGHMPFKRLQQAAKQGILPH